MLSFYSTEKQQQLVPGKAPLPQCACLHVTDWERNNKYVWGFGSFFLKSEGKICQLLVST